jgi:putative intracellular protease/amidase
VGFLRTERTWTTSFNNKFREMYGFDPALYYPALWYNIGPDTEAARVALFNTRSELMAEGYPKMVTGWTKAHGLKNTGHPPGNYGIQPVDMSGDIFKFYRYTDIPLTDLIIQYGRGRDGFKLVSSASDLYDRPITATEIYGALREEAVDPPMLYRALMEIQARGVNFVIPHGMWYDPAKVSIPPLVSPFSAKLAPSLPAYSDYVGRTCYLLQGGRRVSEVAVLYPIASLQGGFHFDAPDNKVAGSWAYPEADYLRISDMLTNEVRRDFTFVHPEYLATDKYSVQGNALHLNNTQNVQDYKTVIIPGGKVMSVETLRKIKQFYDAGGKVIATTLLPSVSAEKGRNQDIVQLVAEMFGAEASTNPRVQTNLQGGRALFVRNPDSKVLAGILEDWNPDADVVFTEAPTITSKLGLFSYLHKKMDGKDIYFFANSSDDEISTEVWLRGKMNLEDWNPHTGEVSRLANVSHVKRHGLTYTRCRLHLKGVQSTFWVSR